MYESKDRMVSHPKHYQSDAGIEVIDVIQAFTKDLTGVEATDTGNIIKYACRWKQKGGIQDLEKIMWYTQHLIDYLRYCEDEEVEPDEDEDEAPECDYDCENCEFYIEDDDEDPLKDMYIIKIDTDNLGDFSDILCEFLSAVDSESDKLSAKREEPQRSKVRVPESKRTIRID